MYDWQVFSTPDPVTWEKEFVLKPEDAFMGHITDGYATDGAERHGKYYFYFSKNQEFLGVAVSTKGRADPTVTRWGATPELGTGNLGQIAGVAVATATQASLFSEESRRMTRYKGWRAVTAIYGDDQLQNSVSNQPGSFWQTLRFLTRPAQKLCLFAPSW